MTGLWQSLLTGSEDTIIVLPSPHGEYKSGISYSDACAMGEIYARFRHQDSLDVRSAEYLGNDISRNLILIGGKKANPMAKRLQLSQGMGLTFELEDGVIFDRDKAAIVTAQYLGAERTIGSVTVDYGVIVYTRNPFGRFTKILSVAGIRGCGTLAAAIAVSDEECTRQIQEILRQRPGGNTDENDTLEVLVRVSVSSGRVQRNSLTIEKIRVRNGESLWAWESEAYSRLGRVPPHKLCVSVVERGATDSPTIRILIDNQEVRFIRSPDRLKLLLALAERAREDYRAESPNEGWVSALELAESIWQFKAANGVVEIPPEVRREVSNVIITWARHLEKQGSLRLEAVRKIDHDYINSEVLVFDVQVKKRIADLVYLINQDERCKVEGSPLIESQPGMGYRLNFHPALITLERTRIPLRETRAHSQSS